MSNIVVKLYMKNIMSAALMLTFKIYIIAEITIPTTEDKAHKFPATLFA